MKTFPLKSLTIEEAMNKQFKLVNEITKEFTGLESLNQGDVGIHPSMNMPQTTSKVERVIARFFETHDCVLVNGSGTGAIREALSSIIKPQGTLLVHTAEIYSTTLTTIEQLGINLIRVDFNNIDALNEILKEKSIDAALVQITRQALDDSYDFKKVVKIIKEANIPVITDDNYAVMKIDKIGVEVGADLSCFSSFKLLGPAGVGIIIGNKDYINRIRKFHYSGGSQVQGYLALEVLRGLVFAPVTHAVQAIQAEKILDELNTGKIEGISKAVIANAQSKVILVKFDMPIAKKVLEIAEELGAAPYPVGAESKFELVPMFYRLSGTMRAKDQEYTDYWIRINPMRSGADTILRILKEAIKRINI